MSDPQLLQGTTVSALTTDSGIVDLSVNSGGGEETTIVSLTSIFLCPFIEKCANSKNRKVGWLCRWCGKKVLAKVSIKGNSPCAENQVG
jgi:hypothetical protein